MCHYLFQVCLSTYSKYILVCVIVDPGSLVSCFSDSSRQMLLQTTWPAEENVGVGED